jgi:arylsulfatase A-like enzyme
VRANYNALLAACDWYLGKVLDFFDEHDMWKDTAIVLTTDHGFLLGEHDWWGKMRMPFYNEVSHIPMIVCHPDHPDQAGTRREALTQTIDIMPTLLDLHGVTVPKDVEGTSVLPLLAEDGPGKVGVLYGMYGASVNITDGRYTYFLYPPDMSDQELYEYTLMPTHMRAHFAPEEFEGATLAEPFRFSKDCPVMKLQARTESPRSPLKGATVEDTTTVLYDLPTDPCQTNPIRDKTVETRLRTTMIDLMARNDAPGEAFRRLGLPVPDGLSHP